MLKISRIPLWFKGGMITLLIFLLMRFMVNPLFDSMKMGPVGNVISQIVGAPLLILSLPLIIFYSYIGFGLDAIFNTGVGYESLSVFTLGVIFMEVSSFIYFFLIGVFIVKIYEKTRKKI